MVEKTNVRALVLWIGGAMALCLAPLAARLGAPLSRLADVSAASFCVAVVIGGASAFVVVQRRGAPSSGATRSWLTVAVFMLLLGRGAQAAGEQRPDRWLGPRGPAAGLRTLTVERASVPGPRCRVRVRAAGVPLWLDAPPEACPLAQGQRIRVRSARLRRHTVPELPGDIDPSAVARSRGAVALATVDQVWRAEGAATPYWGWVARQRQRAWQVTRGDAPAGFVVAAALGVRAALSPDRREALRRAGLGHLIAVSGLHVAVAAWALLVVGRWVSGRLGGTAAAGIVVSWIVLAGYVALTGASPPAVRAGVMAAAVGLGMLIGRPHHGPVVLAATSTVMLVVRPAWCLDPGFQLSVAAMAVLVRAPHGGGVVHQTWRVTWAIMPLSLWHFGQAGVWGLLSNLVAVPIFTVWILPVGLLGWCLVPWLGGMALAPAAWGAQLVLDVAQLVARLPVPSPAQVGVVAAIMVLMGLFIGRRAHDGRLRPRWQWLPPLPAALAVVVVSLWPEPSRLPDVRWWAAGNPRAPAVVSVHRAGGRTTGCVHAVGLAPRRWWPVLDALGVDDIGFAQPARAPHELALADALRARRRLVDVPVCAVVPGPEAIRRALTHCRRRAGTRHAMVAETADGLQCFVGNRFEPLVAHRGMTTIDPATIPTIRTLR